MRNYYDDLARQLLEYLQQERVMEKYTLPVDKRMSISKQNCITCNKEYLGTKYQKWCEFCKDKIQDNNYFQEYYL